MELKGMYVIEIGEIGKLSLKDRNEILLKLAKIDVEEVIERCVKQGLSNLEIEKMLKEILDHKSKLNAIASLLEEDKRFVEALAAERLKNTK